MCVREQTTALLVATVAARHESCVDEHIDYSCDCIYDFQTEVGLMHVETATVSTRWTVTRVIPTKTMS